MSRDDIVCLFVLLSILSSKANGQFMTWMMPYNISSGVTDWSQVLGNVPANCSLQHVHFIGRHGTRTPSKHQIDEAAAVVEKVAKHATNPPPDSVKKVLHWKPYFNQGPETLLPRGVDELKYLAHNFINLFSAYNLSGGTLKFSSSKSARTVASSDAFAKEWPSMYTLLENTVDNTRLAPFTACPRYFEKLYNNPSSRPECAEFPNTPEALKLVEQLNERLWSTNDSYGTRLTYSNISALYYMLGFERATNVNSSLGSLFLDSDLQLFDYADDLETWWKSGYGHSLNYKIACGVLRQVFELSVDPIKYSGVFEFTHSETLVAIYTALGLFRDSRILNANATREFIQQRLFKGSDIATFASNIAFLFFDCPEIDDITGDVFSERQLVVVVNGKVVRLPEACPTSDRCPLFYVREAYQWITTCDQAQICKL